MLCGARRLPFFLIDALAVPDPALSTLHAQPAAHARLSSCAHGAAFCHGQQPYCGIFY